MGHATSSGRQMRTFDQISCRVEPRRAKRRGLFAMICACSLAYLASNDAASASADQRPDARGMHTFSVQGVHLWYRVAGMTSGTPVVFLHGGPGEGSQTFARYAGPRLEKQLRMVYLDQRGSGHSERPKDPTAYSISLLVDDIEALRRHLGALHIDLIGHSFGTVLALEYAARYPDHVAHIVLAAAVPDLPRLIDIQCQRLQAMDAVAYARAASGKPPRAYPRCNSFNAYEGAAEAEFIHHNMYPRSAIGRRVDEADAANGLGNTGELSEALIGQGLWDYRFEAAAKVTAPVLVIAGGRDYQAAEAPQRDLAHALPHARLLVYPDDGHFMFMEEPGRFAADVEAFFHE